MLRGTLAPVPAVPDQPAVPAEPDAPAEPSPDWDAVGALLAQVLSQLAASPGLAGGDGISLSHVPSRSLGRERGLDLRWEVDLLRRGEVTHYDNGDHPAAALRVFADAAPGAAPPGWEAVGARLRQITDLSHRLLSEDAVVDLTASWDQGRAPSGWAWRFKATVGDALDDPQFAFAYDGDSPAEVLQSALDDAASWAPR